MTERDRRNRQLEAEAAAEVAAQAADQKKLSEAQCLQAAIDAQSQASHDDSDQALKSSTRTILNVASNSEKDLSESSKPSPKKNKKLSKDEFDRLKNTSPSTDEPDKVKQAYKAFIKELSPDQRKACSMQTETVRCEDGRSMQVISFKFPSRALSDKFNQRITPFVKQPAVASQQRTGVHSSSQQVKGQVKGQALAEQQRDQAGNEPKTPTPNPNPFSRS